MLFNEIFALDSCPPKDAAMSQSNKNVWKAVQSFTIGDLLEVTITLHKGGCVWPQTPQKETK